MTYCLVGVSASQSSRKCSMSSVVFALHISQFVYPSVCLLSMLSFKVPVLALNYHTSLVHHTATVIDNIFCNVPFPIDISDVGILRPYISDHHGIFCVMNSEKQKQNQHSYVKRNFTNKSIKSVITCLNRNKWDTIYHCDTQTAFTRFQDLFNLNVDKCFI